MAIRLPSQLSIDLGPQPAVWIVLLLTTDIVTRRLSPEAWALVFGVWLGGVPVRAHHPSSSSTPNACISRLTLKLFRRERAISRFDQTLTPPHSSSQFFSTNMGSGLQRVLPLLHPGHGQITRVSRLAPATARPIQTRFRSASGPIGLRLATEANSRAHYAKSTRSPRRAPTACKRTVSGAISLPSQGCLSSFSHLTGPLSVVEEYLALEGGPPMFTPGFTSPTLLQSQTANYRAFTFFGHAFQRVHSALSAFARRYLRSLG
eukprot:TRINITY_DN961_c4_g1_i1.p1 TRINITY_DN961_c4_g1~~TRINITY_DN961_c4_g1_i1.p1  ORF type:complete len:262 (-),score=-13.10 TRINITY_DN961_c4_g1_i1:597-1382(-)